MALLSIPNVKMVGLAAAVPQQIAYNSEYTWLSERERALLIKTTGIEQRRIAQPKQCASDLCYAAAERLITALNWQKSDIQALIFISQTPDYITPATSIVLQHRLGLSQSCLAFDINLGCSAYVYGLSVIGSLLSNGGIKKALLLVGDTASSIISDKDKSTTPIFADAGSATAFIFDQSAAPMHFNLQSDGAGYQDIIVPDGGARNPIKTESLQEREVGKGIVRNQRQMAMNGLSIFNFTMKAVAPNILGLLAQTQQTTDDFDFFVFHQANKLLNERIRKKLKVPAEKVPYSLQYYGNTSCTTVPLTMVTQIRKALKEQSLSLLLSGFGVGLSWGSVSLQTDRLICPPLIELP